MVGWQFICPSPQQLGYAVCKGFQWCKTLGPVSSKTSLSKEEPDWPERSWLLWFSWRIILTKSFLLIDERVLTSSWIVGLMITTSFAGKEGGDGLLIGTVVWVWTGSLLAWLLQQRGQNLVETNGHCHCTSFLMVGYNLMYINDFIHGSCLMLLRLPSSSTWSKKTATNKSDSNESQTPVLFEPNLRCWAVSYSSHNLSLLLKVLQLVYSPDKCSDF